MPPIGGHCCAPSHGTRHSPGISPGRQGLDRLHTCPSGQLPFGAAAVSLQLAPWNGVVERHTPLPVCPFWTQTNTVFVLNGAQLRSEVQEMGGTHSLNPAPVTEQLPTAQS